MFLWHPDMSQVRRTTLRSFWLWMIKAVIQRRGRQFYFLFVTYSGPTSIFLSPYGPIDVMAHVHMYTHIHPHMHCTRANAQAMSISLLALLSRFLPLFPCLKGSLYCSYNSDNYREISGAAFQKQVFVLT